MRITNNFTAAAMAATFCFFALWSSFAAAQQPLGETFGESIFERDERGGEHFYSREFARVEGTTMESESWYDGSPGTTLVYASSGTAAEVVRPEGDGARAETSTVLTMREDGGYDFSRSSAIIERGRNGEERRGDSLVDVTFYPPADRSAPFDVTLGSRSMGDSRTWERTARRSR